MIRFEGFETDPLTNVSCVYFEVDDLVDEVDVVSECSERKLEVVVSRPSARRSAGSHGSSSHSHRKAN